MTAAEQFDWQPICKLTDLVAGSGVCALMGAEQVALFYLPQEKPSLYALGNRDPLGGANVLSRGIVGDLGGRLVVASPLYKQHFELETGKCLEEEAAVPVFSVRLDGENVLIRPDQDRS